MKPQIKELNELLKLLQLEKEQDFEQFKQYVQSLSLSERQEEGYSWYPLSILKSGYTIGERAFVVVERSESHQKPHQFRSGKIVNLFTKQEGIHKPEKSGVINYVDKNKMKIVLNAKDLPDWLSSGMIGVDLMFDDRTYQEMEKAMKKVIKADRDRLAELRDILLGQLPPQPPELLPFVDLPQLNKSQQAAVNGILATKDVSIIHGPPGTGKTTTLVQAVQLLCERENTVLVTAPSNAAVDLLTERLSLKGLVVVRVGNIGRVDEDIIRHTLEARLSSHPESKNIKKLKIQAAETRRKARRYKRRFGPAEREQRRALLNEARELSAWANQLEDRLIEQLLDAADVITCTLVGSNNQILEKRKFKTVVIDEAAQALEPACWIPISKASKVVMAGDPFQLPPTIKSHKARKEGLGQTLVEKAIERLPKVHLLNVQYRMHQLIMNFSNQLFYSNELLAHQSVATQKLTIEENHPVVFIDTAGCGFGEELEPQYKSRFNPGEYNILREHLYQIVDAIVQDQPLPPIGIISPYREQVLFIKKAIEEDEKLSNLNISINTIDAFQGQEREIIYISLVRSNTSSEIGFLKDYRRMNVAMTRAKKKLVVVGDSSTIGADDFYGSFLDYCDTKGTYRSAWDFML